MKTLILGAAIVDIIMKIPELPKKGEDVSSTETILSVGGCAYNVSHVLKNFNVNHDLFVPIGSGIHADIIKKDLIKNNYKILINDVEMDNGYSLCLVEEDGERTFITSQGIEGKYKEEWFNNINMKEYENVYVAGYQVCGHSGEIISNWLTKQKSKTIFFAPGPVINEIEKRVMDKIMLTNPILHLNEKEALDFTGKCNVKESILNLYNFSKNIVFITMGEEGTLFYDGEKIIKIQGEKANVINTIGAGDSHIGTIISIYSKGYDFTYALEIANKVACQTVQIQESKLDKEAFDKLNILI